MAAVIYVQRQVANVSMLNQDGEHDTLCLLKVSIEVC